MRLQRVASMSAAKGIEGSRPILARQRKFPVPEIRELAVRPPKSDPIMEVALPEPADSDVFPCTFPVLSLRIKELSPRDGFAADCPHRHLVCVSGDFAAGARIIPKTPGLLGNALATPNRRPSGVGAVRTTAARCLRSRMSRFGMGLA